MRVSVVTGRGRSSVYTRKSDDGVYHALISRVDGPLRLGGEAVPESGTRLYFDHTHDQDRITQTCSRVGH